MTLALGKVFHRYFSLHTIMDSDTKMNDEVFGKDHFCFAGENE